MYVMSQREVVLLFAGNEQEQTKIRNKIKECITQNEPLCIQNFIKESAIEYLLLQYILPVLGIEDYLELNFFSLGIKKSLDKILKKYYIKNERSKENKTRIYRIYAC